MTTLRSLLASSLLFGPLFLAGCAGAPSGPDVPAEEAPDPVSLAPGEVRIAVRGALELYPPAQAWMVQTGRELPQLDGLRVRVVEPLRGMLGDGTSTFGEVTVGAEASFRVTEVPAGELTLGLAAAVDDPADTADTVARVARSTTLLYDTAREGRLPLYDLRDQRAWVLPQPFVWALNRAVGPERVASVAPGMEHIREAGYVLGQVVDAAGAPLAGVRVTVQPAELGARVFYPDTELRTAGQDGTSGSGLFVLVHDGGDVRTFTLTVDGRTDIPTHGGAAARGVGLVMTVSPDLP